MPWDESDPRSANASVVAGDGPAGEVLDRWGLAQD